MSYKKFYGRINAAALFLLALAVAVIAILSIQKNKERDLEQISEYIEDISQSTATQIAGLSKNHKAAISVAANLYGAALRSSIVDLDLLAELEKDTDFDYIRFIDILGTDYASSGAVADCSDRDYFKDGIAGNTGITVVESSRINAEKLVGFYAPVYYSDEICGILVGFLGETTISKALETSLFGYPTDTYVIDRDGNVIGQYEYDGAVQCEMLKDAEMSLTAEQIVEIRLATGQRRSASVEIKAEGTETVGYLRPITGTEWAVLQIFPGEAAKEIRSKAVSDSIRTIVILVVACALGIIIFLWTYWKIGRAFAKEEVTKERERTQTEMRLIAAAAKTVYPFIMEQNLTQDTVRVLYYEEDGSLVQAQEDEDCTVDEMIANVARTIPDRIERNRF